MEKITLFLIVTSLIMASSALGGNPLHTSGDYYKDCQESIKFYKGESADKLAAASCLGFVEGSSGMHTVFNVSDQGAPFYCMSEGGISSIDLISIWIEFLEKNPQMSNNTPTITFILAISEAFPCN